MIVMVTKALEKVATATATMDSGWATDRVPDRLWKEMSLSY